MDLNRREFTKMASFAFLSARSAWKRRRSLGGVTLLLAPVISGCALPKAMASLARGGTAGVDERWLGACRRREQTFCHSSAPLMNLMPSSAPQFATDCRFAHFPWS